MSHLRVKFLTVYSHAVGLSIEFSIFIDDVFYRGYNSIRLYIEKDKFMFPIIDVFGFEIGTYSVLAVVGFVITALVSLSFGKRRNIPYEKTLLMILICGAGLFLGGHFLFALTNIKEIALLFQRGEMSYSALRPLISGMVFYGGLIGASAALLIYIKADSTIPKGDAFDVFAVAVPLFHTFGRIGCFLAGCCYGVESDFGFVTEYNNAPAHFGVVRFPVQLFEASGNLLIFILLVYFFKRNILKSKLFVLYLGIYAPMRFALEFFRGDEVRGFVMGLSTSQLISLIIMIAMLIYSSRLYMQSKKKSNSE